MTEFLSQIKLIQYFHLQFVQTIFDGVITLFHYKVCTHMSSNILNGILVCLIDNLKIEFLSQIK